MSKTTRKLIYKYRWLYVLMIPALVSFLTDRLRAQGAQTEVVQTHCVPFPGALNT